MLIIGASGGLLSGLLGIGGGIVLFPALLYLPPLMGFDAIDVRHITGLTMVQGFFASVVAWIFYQRRGFVVWPLVFWLGVPLSLMSFLGAVVSSRAESVLLLAVFGILALIAALMILKPPAGDDEIRKIGVRKLPSLCIGAFLGFFLGMVGQGGAFIVIPVMLVVLKIPFRHAAGTMLAISLIATSAGFLGKTGVGLVHMDVALVLLSGTIPMAWVGGVLSVRIRKQMLRRILAVIILASAIRVGTDVYSSIIN